MKLLIISNMYPSTKDPAYGTFVKEFTESMCSLNGTENTDTVFIKGRDSSKFKKLFKYIKFYLTIFFSLIFKTYDCIYVHTIAFPTPPIYIASILKRLNLVFNIHGTDLLGSSFSTKTLRTLAKPLLRKSAFIVVPSEFFKPLVLDFESSISPDKVIISPSGGIDLSLFHPDTYPIANSKFTIGYVSRIDEGKGWDVLLKAMDLLKRQNIDIHAIIVGRGAQEYKLTNMVDNLDLSNDVTVAGGVAHSNLPAYFQKMDLFVFPTMLQESLGLVGIEAMACGLPVIGSNIGALPTYIVDKVNGFLFAAGNARELANAIMAFKKLPEIEVEKMKHNALLTAVQYNKINVMSDLYNILLNK